MLIPKKWWALTFFFLSAFTASIQSYISHHKVVILTEPGPGESQYNSSAGFLTQKLRDSLEQSSVPLIVSGVVLDNFFSFAHKWPQTYSYTPPAYYYHEAYQALENSKWRIFKYIKAD